MFLMLMKVLPAVWRLDSSGNVLTEKFIAVEGMGQLAKIRRDASNGFIASSTAWGVMGGQDVNVVALVKLTCDLHMDWSQTVYLYIPDEMYGVALDSFGNYLLLGGSGNEYPYSASGSGQWLPLRNTVRRLCFATAVFALCLCQIFDQI